MSEAQAAPGAAPPDPGRPLGRHLGTGPGLAQAIDAARRIGCTSAQIFSGNPTGWRHVHLTPARAAEARAGWSAAGVRPLTIHAPYIINLASPDETIYANSRRAIRDALIHAAALGAPFVTVHLGSHKGTGHDAGAARLIAAVVVALDDLPAGQFLLLENNVGAGNSMGGTLDLLGGLLRDAAHPQLGVCIDTAHLWGGGHDITTAEGVARTVEAIDGAIGLDQVRVLHLNDSPVPLGSRRDQHAHLGQGRIGYEGLAALLIEPGLAGIPAILETPDGGVEQEIIRLRAAALLCNGDAEAARAYQEEALPAPASRSAATEAAAGGEATVVEGVGA